MINVVTETTLKPLRSLTFREVFPFQKAECMAIDFSEGEEQAIDTALKYYYYALRCHGTVEQRISKNSRSPCQLPNLKPMGDATGHRAHTGSFQRH